MARPVPNGAILEVANIGTCNGQRVMNVWHYKLNSVPPATPDGDALVAALTAVIQPGGNFGLLPDLKALCNEICTWQYIRYQWITPIRYSPTINAVSSGPGTVVAEPLPQNVCGVVTLKSIFGGPGSTGRKHFGGLSQTDEASGLMSNQFIVNAGSLVSNMSVAIDTTLVAPGSELVPVIYDRTEPANSIAWTEFEVQTTSRVIRRRTVGVGI